MSETRLQWFRRHGYTRQEARWLLHKAEMAYGNRCLGLGRKAKPFTKPDTREAGG